MNVLKSHLRITIETLAGCGVSQREIDRRTGVDRKTIRRYVRDPNSPGVATGSEQLPPPWPPAPGSPQAGASAIVSACERHRTRIEAQVQLGRNAQSIYQDLVGIHEFGHGYNSVKRIVSRLKRRDPERFDVLEFLPGEECQVDYGEG